MGLKSLEGRMSLQLEHFKVLFLLRHPDGFLFVRVQLLLIFVDWIMKSLEPVDETAAHDTRCAREEWHYSAGGEVSFFGCFTLIFALAWIEWRFPMWFVWLFHSCTCPFWLYWPSGVDGWEDGAFSDFFGIGCYGLAMFGIELERKV